MKKHRLYRIAGTTALTGAALASGFSTSFAAPFPAPETAVAAAPTSENVATSNFTMEQALETLYQQMPDAAVRTITVEASGDYYVWLTNRGKELELMITPERKIVQLPS